MNPLKERLNDIEKNGYQIDFGNVFNHAFENYKKIALYAWLVLFVFMIIFAILISVSVASIIGVTAMTQELSPAKLNVENLSETNILLFGLVAIVATCVLSPFQAGFLKMADCGDRDEEFNTASLFCYYKPPYLKEIFITTLLITSVNFAQAMLFSFIKTDFIGTIVNYAISFITLLSVPLIIFGHLKAIEAIKYSIIIVLKQPLVLFGLMVVAVIGSLVGIMGCCIGVFFTIPFLVSMNYAIYNAIIGVDSQSKLEETDFVI